MARTEQPTTSDGSPPDVRPPPIVEPVIIPVIDFDTPTGDPLVGIRKGFGAGSVGNGSPTGPSEPPPPANQE